MANSWLRKWLSWESTFGINWDCNKTAREIIEKSTHMYNAKELPNNSHFPCQSNKSRLHTLESLYKTQWKYFKGFEVVRKWHLFQCKVSLCIFPATFFRNTRCTSLLLGQSLRAFLELSGFVCWWHICIIKAYKVVKPYAKWEHQ